MGMVVGTRVVFEARKLRREMYEIYVLLNGSSASISLIIKVRLADLPNRRGNLTVEYRWRYEGRWLNIGRID